jgi:hypothetical protein
MPAAQAQEVSMICTISLFGARNSLFPVRTGNASQHLGFAIPIDAKRRQNRPAQADSSKIPCYFPCFQGIAASPHGNGGNRFIAILRLCRRRICDKSADATTRTLWAVSILPRPRI